MVNEKLVEGLQFFSPVSDDEGNVESYFSWSSCDACNSSLGGDRYDVACRDDENNIIELSVCADCYVNLCS